MSTNLTYYPDDGSAEAASHNAEVDRFKAWRSGRPLPAMTAWERLAYKRSGFCVARDTEDASVGEAIVQQDVTAECVTVDCRSCGAALIGGHYHLYGYFVMGSFENISDYIGCLCLTCYEDILSMVQSYVGA